MIILLQQVELQKEGKLKFTGKKIKVVDLSGELVEIDEIQPIHTYNGWKSRGYQVKKGEKAIAKFPVWAFSAKKKSAETEDDENVKGTGHMYMKMSAFFSDEQVEKIEEKEVK